MYLYYDIETVPDTKLPKDLEDALMDNVKPDARARDKEASLLEKREKLREEFGLYPLTNQIVAICATAVDQKGKAYSFEQCEPNEKKLLSAFNKFISDAARESAEAVIPVTFNGKSFDHHCLFIKYAQYGLDSPPFGFMFGKYDQNHIDLRMVLVNYDQYGRGTLDIWARRLGYPEMEKQEHKGSDIKLLFETKQYKTIVEKCTGDVERLVYIHRKLQPYM